MITRNALRVSILIVILLCAIAGAARATGPGFINYRATLTDGDGNPVPNGTYDVYFGVYADETPGQAALWSESHTVETINGGFKVKLGSIEAMPEDLFADTLRWIGITVAPDDEMVPRTLIGSVPWALNAAFADKVADKSVGKDQIQDNGVGKGQLDERAVGKAKIDTLAVDTGKISLKAVGKDQIKDKGVGRGQLDDKAVGQGQLDDKAVGRGQLDDSAVGSAQLDLYAVTPDKINNGAVGLGKLAHDGVLDGQIIKWDAAAYEWVYDYDQTIEPGSSHWTLTGDVLETAVECSIVKAGNLLVGNINKTHVNFGRGCQTGDPASGTVVFTTISGGANNKVLNHYCTIAGGLDNEAGGYGATVGGGAQHRANGDYSVIPGGLDNVAEGHHSFAAGSRTHALHDGTVVISAVEDSETERIRSGQDGQMVLRADGHFYLTDDGGVAPGEAVSNFLDTSTGAYLSLAGTWQSVSARDTKENFTPLDGQQLLDTLADLEITRWNYKIDGVDVQHIGPVAEDFHALFGIGLDDKTISSLDPAGVALAAIQALHEKTTELEKNSNETAELKHRVDDLTRLVEQLIQERTAGGRGQ